MCSTVFVFCVKIEALKTTRTSRKCFLYSVAAETNRRINLCAYIVVDARADSVYSYIHTINVRETFGMILLLQNLQDFYERVSFLSGAFVPRSFCQ